MSQSLITPVVLKQDRDAPVPENEPVYYLLTRDGLFLNRKHRFFESSVPAPCWPRELAAHRPFLKLKYPKISRSMLERVVGFFDVIARRSAAEAAVLLAWDEVEKTLRVLVPEQISTVVKDWQGYSLPISLQYEVPPLPTGWTLIGDIHSHVCLEAYASATDKEDESHRPGLHIVVGRLDREPPEFHVDIIVDGMRFPITDPGLVLGGYLRRRSEDVPQTWIASVTPRILKGTAATMAPPLAPKTKP